MTDTIHRTDLLLDDDVGERPVVTRYPPSPRPLFQPLSTTVRYPPGPVPDVHDAVPEPVPTGSRWPGLRRWASTRVATRVATRVPTAARTMTWTRSRVVAGLLGVFLGGLGLHRMYLGHWRRGLTMLAVTVVGGLLTFGVASVVMGLCGFTEGLLVLCARRGRFAHDARGRPLHG